MHLIKRNRQEAIGTDTCVINKIGIRVDVFERERQTGEMETNHHFLKKETKNRRTEKKPQKTKAALVKVSEAEFSSLAAALDDDFTVHRPRGEASARPWSSSESTGGYSGAFR